MVDVIPPDSALGASSRGGAVTCDTNRRMGMIVVVVALDRGHSRVAESTRLTSEGGYPGRCKLFFRSSHGARTQEHTRS